METTIQTVEDSLIEGLSFKLGNSSNYILDRKSSTWYPTGSNVYTPLGTRMLKFVLSGTDWLDPGTVRLQFKLSNKTTGQALKLLNGNPANFFRRMRIVAGGQVIEDIDYYNRVSNMIQHLMPNHKKMNDASEAFQMSLKYETIITGSGTGVIRNSVVGSNILNYSPVIEHGEFITVQMPLLSGLLNCGKMLPLKYLQGLQIELELVNSYIDAACGNFGAEPTWEISEACIKADSLLLDSQLDNEYTSHLLEGKTLPIQFSSFVHQVASAGNTDRPTISLSRAFTRLKSCYITLYRKIFITDETPATGTAPAKAEFTNEEAIHLPWRESTFFYHPQFLYPGHAKGTAGYTNKDLDNIENPETGTKLLTESTGYYDYNHQCNVESQIQIGSKLIPEQPVRNSQEQFYQLRKTLGAHEQGSTYSVDILPHEYRSWKFIMGFDLQKALGAAFSGINTRAGDLLTIKLNRVKHIKPDGSDLLFGGDVSATYAQFIHTTLEYDAILQISDNGVQVFE